MAQTGQTGAVLTPSLNAILVARNPTTGKGNPATSVQIQNASPFALQISTSAEQYTITQFTAQTVPVTGDGTDVTIVPVAGPAGLQGTITPIWLLAGQDPPQADGQLTGAAQYAVGLGTTLYGPTTGPTSGLGQLTLPVTLPPTTRTLVVSIACSNAAAFPFELQVSGTTSLFNYALRQFYLESVVANQQLAIVPVNPLIDPVVQVQISAAAALVFTVTAEVFADTAQYEENRYYGAGDMAVLSASGGVNSGDVLFKNGPFRVHSVTLEAQNGAAILLSNGTAGANNVIARCDALANTNNSLTLTFGGSDHEGLRVPVAPTGSWHYAGSAVAGGLWYIGMTYSYP